VSKILAFDCATQAGSVAVFNKDTVVAKFDLMPRMHSKLLLPAIESCLKDSDVTLNELDAIAVTQGPGSFMGVRLGIGLAQGLAFGANLPVVLLSTMQVIAQTAFMQSHVDHVIAGWDARMDAIYWGEYKVNESGVMQCLTEDLVTPVAKVKLPESNVVLVGNAWDAYPDVFANVSSLSLYPDAKAMLPLVIHNVSNGNTVDAMNIQPVYLRNNVARKKS